MITVHQARARILDTLAPGGVETVPLAQACGRVARQDLKAQISQPGFDQSAMDGYALRAGDANKTLPVSGIMAAGDDPDQDLPANTAMRIFTGAPLPRGADTVIVQEDAVRTGDQVRFSVPGQAGRHIRRTGFDFAAQQVVINNGKRLNFRDCALAAAANIPTLSVATRPRVAFLATGDELVAVGTPPRPGQLPSSNGFGLAALIAWAGGQPVDLGLVGDDEADIAAAAAPGRQADIFLTIGGASVGDRDLVQSALAHQGLEIDFWKIAMRPGKPLIFGRYGDVPMLGLPGNPVSALTVALLFLVPALAKIQGWTSPPPLNFATGTTGTALPANGPRETYMRVEVDGDGIATPLPVQDSAGLSAFAQARALLVRPINAPALAAGAAVNLLYLPEF